MPFTPPTVCFVRVRCLAALPLTLSLAMLSGCGASVIPAPTERDVVRAMRRWPDASLADLQRGRALMLDRCVGCHTLVAPTETAEERWPTFLNDMARRARLSDSEREAVLRYVLTAREAGG